MSPTRVRRALERLEAKALRYGQPFTAARVRELRLALGTDELALVLRWQRSHLAWLTDAPERRRKYGSPPRRGGEFSFNHLRRARAILAAAIRRVTGVHVIKGPALPVARTFTEAQPGALRAWWRAVVRDVEEEGACARLFVGLDVTERSL